MGKLFVTLDELKFRMTINPELQGVDDALESAITASQLRIESFLDSKINQASYTAKFFLDKNAYSDIQVNGLFRCYLKSGFVQKGSPIVVTFGDKWNSTPNVMPTTDYYVDSDKGILYIDAGQSVNFTSNFVGSNAAQMYGDQYITVTHTSGYTKGADIPDWLRECIISYAPVVLNFSEVVKRSDLNEGGYKTSGDHALAIASPYLRNVGFLIRPIF